MFSEKGYDFEWMVKDPLHKKNNSTDPSGLFLLFKNKVCRKLIDHMCRKNENGNSPNIRHEEDDEEKYMLIDSIPKEYKQLMSDNIFDIKRAVLTFKGNPFNELNNQDKFLLSRFLSFFEEKHLDKHNLKCPNTETKAITKNILLGSVRNDFKKKIKEYIQLNEQQTHPQKKLQIFVEKTKNPQSFNDLTFAEDFKKLCLLPLEKKVKLHRKKRSIYILAASTPLIFVLGGYFIAIYIDPRQTAKIQEIAGSVFLFFILTGLFCLYKVNAHENMMQEASYHCSMDNIIDVPCPAGSESSPECF